MCSIQPAFLVKPCSNLEHVHRNTWKILTRKAVSFVLVWAACCIRLFPWLREDTRFSKLMFEYRYYTFKWITIERTDSKTIWHFGMETIIGIIDRMKTTRNILEIYQTEECKIVSEARIFGKHSPGNQGKSSRHGGNSLLDKFGRVYIL